MNKNSLLCLLFFTPLLSAADDHIENTLNYYKKFLDKGTYEGAPCINSLAVKPQTRYYTFKKAFEHFVQHQGKVIVELGTTRSYTHGGLPGCMQDNIKYWEPKNPESWDWGAGFFTRMALECLAPYDPIIHTIDIAPAHINRCKVMTQDFKDFIHYHVTTSEAFLNQCQPESIDLLYMDTGDIDHATALLHLREAKIIVERNLISPNGIILIDDIKNFIPGDPSQLGKGKYSVPYLLSHGFEMVADEYQVMLKKSSR